MLWRRFPTDRRVTYFRTFWNKLRNPLPTQEGPDIDEIHTWTDEGLGSNIGNPNVVLLLRGELLRQFPNTSIYMVKAEWKTRTNDDETELVRAPKLSAARHITEEKVQKLRTTDDPADDPRGEIKFPIFRGTLDPDVTFMGFDIAPETAVGDDLQVTDPVRLADEYEEDETEDEGDPPDPGWFLVFEEPMGETRFGLDEGGSEDGNAPIGVETPGTETGTSGLPDGLDDGQEAAWNGLSWHHVADDPSATAHLSVWDSRPGSRSDGTNTSWRVSKSRAKTLHERFGDTKPDVESSFAVWGRNSAHMARITFQRPVRVSIHADYLLDPEANASTEWRSVTGESSLDAGDYPEYFEDVDYGNDEVTHFDGTDWQRGDDVAGSGDTPGSEHVDEIEDTSIVTDEADSGDGQDSDGDGKDDDGAGDAGTDGTDSNDGGNQ
jgi:hypothetical protein